MTERMHPVDDALRWVAGSPAPSDIDRRAAELRLAALFDAHEPIARRWLRSYRVPAWATILIALVVAVFSLVQVIRPPASTAALEEIASAAETVHPLLIPHQAYAYTSSELTYLNFQQRDALGEIPFDREGLAYLLPVSHETWVGGDGTTQIREKNHPPIFFSSTDETAYYAAGLDDADAIDQTITQVVEPQDQGETWPEAIEDLDAAIRANVVDRGFPDSVEYLDVAIDILRDPFISPDLRSNTLRLIADLPDLILVESGQETTFALDYRDRGIATRATFTLDVDGYLLAERTVSLEADETYGIPADTATFSAQYERPKVVGSLDTP